MRTGFGIVIRLHKEATLLLMVIHLVSFSSAGELVYSTFLGKPGIDEGNSIALDKEGNIYITGCTESINFPVTAYGYSTIYQGNGDIFVSKLNATGSMLLYSTLIGGSEKEKSNAIAVDAYGNAYIIGNSASPDFPTTPGAYDTTYNSSGDVLVLKLNATGTTLLYSTYLGGSYFEQSYDADIDYAGNIYITGMTSSVNFPTTPGAVDTTFNGSRDVFITKLNVTGSALVYSTFLGGSNVDNGYSIKVDSAGNAYICGGTFSANFPTTNHAFDRYYGGNLDGFVTKLNPSGSELVYSTFIGGNEAEDALALALDSSGNVYIAGRTESTNFPTTNQAYDTTRKSEATDIFVSKLNSTGSELVYSTFLGGSGGINRGKGIVLDAADNIYLTGWTTSGKFPVIPGEVDTSYHGGYDVIVAKLNKFGSAVDYFTYLGGTGDEYCNGIAIDTANIVYLVGFTSSSDFPTTTNAFDTIFDGPTEVFISKFTLIPNLNQYGAFTISNDTSYWYFEKYGDGIAAGILSWDSSFAGQSGLIKLLQIPGEKGKVTQVFSVLSTGWYTAIAKVATDIADESKQPKVYLSLQELDATTTIIATGSQVVQLGSGGLGSGWKPLEISFYATGTILAVQVVAINNTNSGATGSLYIDDIWVYAGGPQVSTPITLTNPSFESGTTGWLIQPYGDAASAGVWTEWSGFLIGGQGGGEKGKASQLYSAPTSNTLGSLWVFSAATSWRNTQKIYLYIYSNDSSYGKTIESGNAILQPGKWTQGQWHQLQFGYTPFTQYNAVQLVGINPAGNPSQSIYFDAVEIKQ